MFLPLVKVQNLSHNPASGFYNFPDTQNLIGLNLSFALFIYLFLPIILLLWKMIPKDYLLMKQIVFIVISILILVGFFKLLLYYFSKSFNTILWGSYILLPYMIYIIYISYKIVKS